MSQEDESYMITRLTHILKYLPNRLAVDFRLQPEMNIVSL